MRKVDSSMNQHLIDCFLHYLITKDEFIRKVRSVVKPEHFRRSEVVRDIVKLCYEFFDVSGSAPKDHFHDEFVRFSDRFEKEKKEYYLQYLQKLQDMEEQQLDEKYILTRINDFVLFHEFDDAAVRFADMTKKGQYEEARQFMTKVLRGGIQEVELGYEWSDLNAIAPYLLPENRIEKLIPLGLAPLDNIYRRKICRTDLVCIAGPYKGKKSWFLHHLGVLGLEAGLKVLHITHENSKEDTWARYDMLVSGMTNEEGEQSVLLRVRDNNGVEIQQGHVQVESIYQSSKKVLDKKKNLTRSGGQLRIQDYPMGRCTMGEIDRFLTRLEIEGFYPDIVINDYIEKMHINPGRARHEEIDEMYKESKAIAMERKLAMITASQLTSANLDRVVKSQTAIAEARSKSGDVDLMLSLSSTEIQRENDITTAYIIANRHGPQFCGCYFDSAIPAGEVVMNCWPASNNNQGE